MKKKTGNQPHGSRPKRNSKLQREKQRKGPKKKLVERPAALWLQIFSRVD